MKLSGDRNQCQGCKCYFNSSHAFDKHRTGEHGIDRRWVCNAGKALRKGGGMKLTEWFPCYVKPVRRGVYETRLYSHVDGSLVSEGYARWTGEYWCNNHPTKYSASRSSGTGLQTKQWRGLAEKP